MDSYRIDGQKISFHPRRVVDWFEARNDWEKAKKIYPIYVELSPAGACNHRCNFCAVDYIGYKTRYLDEQILKDRLLEMGSKGVRSVMFAGEGEPLLYKPLGDVILAAKTAGLDVAITTNATPMTPSFLEKALGATTWIKCSINAGTKETYAKIHQTSESHFDLALSNLAKAVAMRKSSESRCTLGAQMVLLPENAGETVILAKRVRDLGADYLVIKPYSQHLMSQTHLYEGIHYAPYFELKETLDKLNDDHFKVVFRIQTMKKLEDQNRYTQCQATPFLWAYVMADGSVYSCSAYLLDERFYLGNIHEEPFAEIWEGEKRRKNFEFVRNHLNISDCRVNCRMDEVNRYLWDLIHPTEHVNFI